MAITLLFEESRPDSAGDFIAPLDVPKQPLDELLPAGEIRTELPLPELAEIDVVRHFTNLSKLNFSIDGGFYPLGSCTMKYNPRINEDMAAHPGSALVHPYQADESVQGCLEIMWHLQNYLAEISGMDACTLQPAAGAHGELTGILLIHAYHQSRGDTDRKIILVPDSAHGTNPATAAMVGYRVVQVPSDENGDVDVEALRKLANERVAGMMLTIPSTLGLFDRHILEITQIIHDCGGQMYCDGANMNAILGQAKLGELGCDVMHFNLHKTFSTPHGGGGPGSGPVCCKAHLAPYLPRPLVNRREQPGGGSEYFQDYDGPESVGRVRAWYGNWGMFIRAFTYITAHGRDGLQAISENAVLNANYVRVLLADTYRVAYDRVCMHEAILSGDRQKAQGARTLDIAKRLIDYGYHPPTIYFPLIVPECIMIEPTETESRHTLEQFVEDMKAIAREVETNPELVRTAPHTSTYGRVDEVRAARQPVLRWQPPAPAEAAVADD